MSGKRNRGSTKQLQGDAENRTLRVFRRLSRVPFGAIEMVDGKSHVRKDLCMGCGVCISRYLHEARSLIPDEGKGLLLDVRKLNTSATCRIVQWIR
jgi:ferredoxin